MSGSGRYSCTTLKVNAGLWLSSILQYYISFRDTMFCFSRQHSVWKQNTFLKYWFSGSWQSDSLQNNEESASALMFKHTVLCSDLVTMVDQNLSATSSVCNELIHLGWKGRLISIMKSCPKPNLVSGSEFLNFLVFCQFKLQLGSYIQDFGQGKFSIF